ncbi:MAG: hypothetical protein K6T78_07945 [Alicyclobacillus sp.]|nr:hypothetical protein [Alicyclobacillus sp.]
MMQFLSATTDAQGIHYSVWLDTTQFAPNSATEPNPAYVREYDWTPAPADWPGGVSAYQQMTLAEVKLLAKADLDALLAAQKPTPQPTPLPVAGQTF